MGLGIRLQVFIQPDVGRWICISSTADLEGVETETEVGTIRLRHHLPAVLPSVEMSAPAPLLIGTSVTITRVSKPNQKNVQMAARLLHSDVVFSSLICQQLDIFDVIFDVRGALRIV